MMASVIVAERRMFVIYSIQGILQIGLSYSVVKTEVVASHAAALGRVALR